MCTPGNHTQCIPSTDWLFDKHRKILILPENIYYNLHEQGSSYRQLTIFSRSVHKVSSLCKFHADFPKSFCQLVVIGLGSPCLCYLTVSQVLPCHSLHLFTDSTVDGGLGSLLRSFNQQQEENELELLQGKWSQRCIEAIASLYE